eukprot:TRINITY_DN1982_c0_g1_i1.p1 TRINITY_DN1982_c0_g1~~TRINITY_DN1982_c0_g1_i1.p1  ORF type:complete len:1322 (+),score=141.27 TRINITY_DN1982_c0_g1_i1:9519-13484(+)
MYPSYPDNARERRRRRHEARSRLQAIASFLIRSERRGLRISPHAQYVLENECLEVFKDYDGPPDTFQFATMLRETAIRMFRQGRYKEANQRYRMASLFNPFDATLLSNRATCIYNLRRYRRCVEICELCFAAFPNLYYHENTGLYFQVLILLANAHIKLRNFDEARNVYRTLVSIKDKLCRQRDTRVSVTEAVNKLRRFEIDLELAKQDASSQIADAGLHQVKPVRPADFPHEEERGRFLHPHTPSAYLREINTGIDDYDLNSKEDGDPTLVVNVEHLCHHVYHMGMGACGHDDSDLIWQIDSDSCSDEDDEGYEENFSFDDDTFDYEDFNNEECTKFKCTCGHFYDQGLDFESREKIPSSEEGNLPTRKEQGPVWNEFGLVRTYPLGEEELPKSQQRSSSNSSSTSLLQARRTADRFSRANSTESRASVETKPTRHKFKNLLAIEEAVDALRSARFSKRCMHLGEKRCQNDTEYRKLVNELTTFVSTGQSNPIRSRRKNKMLYDSETEEPVYELNFSRAPKIEDTDFLSKAIRVLPSGNDTFLSRCITEIFGSAFHSTGVLDFTRYFGPHNRLQSQGGKKKSKNCDRNCAPCFARRMWKLRFKSNKAVDAEQFFAEVCNDRRRDERNFLPVHEWGSSGAYGSGYELAAEQGILVHGVPFLILLQNEVYWQKNELGCVKSIQNPFRNALSKNLKTGTDLLAISTLYNTLLDALLIIEGINYLEWKKVPRSHQFVRTANLVAEMASRPPDCLVLHEMDKVARLISYNGTTTENMTSWALAGHLAKEEEWVYHTLLLDVGEVMLHFTRSVFHINPTLLPRNAVHGEDARSSTLERILYRQRCRELEKNAISRKGADLERGEILLSRSIEAFPLKLRLYLSRAEIRFQMSKWDGCIRDLNKLQSLVSKQENSASQSLHSEQQKRLLFHALLLEGDAHKEKAKQSNSAQKSHIVASIDLYKRAINIWSRKKKNRSKILQKVKEQEHLLVLLENSKHGVKRDESSTIKLQRTQKPSTLKQVVTSHVNSASSSEDEEDALIPGSRYGALLKDRSRILPTEKRRQATSQPSISGTVLDSVDGRRNRRRRVKPRPNNEPPPGLLLSEVRRVLSLFGGEARSSAIIDNLDLTGWNIENAGNYISKTFGALHSLCSEFGEGFETRAGSQSDPVIALTNEGEFTPVSRKKPSSTNGRRQNNGIARGRPALRRNQPSRRPSTITQFQSENKPEIRTSRTLDYAKIVEDLMTEEQETTTQNRDSSELTDREKECCICLDNPSDCLTIPCRHPFCESCILDYLARENSDKLCPVCRSSITNVASMVVHQSNPWHT